MLWTRLVSASAVGYYGPHAPGEVQEESSPPGEDFLAQLCVKWEGALSVAQEAGVPGARFAKNSGQELWARALTGSPSEHAVLARRSGIRRFMSRVGPLCPEGGV